MPMLVRVSGVWRTVNPPRVRVAGVWRTVSQGYVRVAGVWRAFYQALRAFWAGVTLESSAVAQQPACYVSFGSDGSGVMTDGGGTTNDYWFGITAGVGNNYDVRFVLVSGTATITGMTSGTWYQLNTTRSLTAAGPPSGSYSITTTVTFQIRLRSSGAIVLTGNTTFLLSREI